MAKYIDADRLRAEIEKQSQGEQGFRSEDAEYGYRSCARYLLDFIDSLQQELPEVDLEKEIDAFWNPRFNFGWDEYSALSMNHSGFASIARHFYELGQRDAGGDV